VPDVIVAMLPNHDWPPPGPNVNHHMSRRRSPRFSTNNPWPGCVGSYHAPVSPAIGPTVGSTAFARCATKNGFAVHAPASTFGAAPPGGVHVTPTGVVSRDRFMK